jgi:hypothetical protein
MPKDGKPKGGNQWDGLEVLKWTVAVALSMAIGAVTGPGLFGNVNSHGVEGRMLFAALSFPLCIVLRGAFWIFWRVSKILWRVIK